MDTLPTASDNQADAPKNDAVYDIVYTDAFVAELWQRLRRCHPGSRLFMRIFRTVTGAFFLGLFAFVLHMAGWHQWRILILLLIILIFLFFSGTFERWLVMRRWRKAPSRNKPTRLILSTEGMAAANDLGQSTNKWAAFVKARRLPDGFMLFVGPSTGYWFPNAALIGGTPASVDSLIKKNVADYHDA